MDIEAARKKHEARLLKLPGVVGVGTGEKMGKRVIKVFVSDEALVSEPIPRSLDGFEIDVEQVGEPTIQR